MKAVKLTFNLMSLAEIFRQGHEFKVIQGLPKDALILERAMGPNPDTVIFTVVSDSYEEVPEGQAPPEINVKLTCLNVSLKN